MKVFRFDAADYKAEFSTNGWVHIRGGATDEFLEFALKQLDTTRSSRPLTGAGIAGAKEQFVFEFPTDAHYCELYDAVAAVCGLDRRTITLSERHLKAYEATADPFPSAHKDRFSSQVSVGISLEVGPGSELVLHTETDRWINPFLAASLRDSLEPERDPDVILQGAPEVVIADSPGDVVIFLGSAMWHLRRHSADTANVYLKFNDFGSDPLGEDPWTPRLREATLSIIDGATDAAIREAIPILGRRFDSVAREYRREGWPETLLARVWDRHPFPVSEEEFAALRRLDGTTTVGELIGFGAISSVQPIIRLAQRGAIDLLSPDAR